MHKVIIAILLVGTVITSCKKVAIKDLEADLNSGEVIIEVQPTNAKGVVELGSKAVSINVDSIVNALSAVDYTISSVTVKSCLVDVVNHGVGINLNPIDSFVINASADGVTKKLASADSIPDNCIYIEPKITKENLISTVERKNSVFKIVGKVSEDIKTKLVLKIRTSYKIVFKHKG